MFFFSPNRKELGVSLPPQGQYATGILFLDPKTSSTAEKQFELLAKELHLEVSEAFQTNHIFWIIIFINHCGSINFKPFFHQLPWVLRCIKFNNYFFNENCSVVNDCCTSYFSLNISNFSASFLILKLYWHINICGHFWDSIYTERISTRGYY